MPQIFQVLRCFKCMVFQVHQTKKSNKWECKLCGEKQSIKRHYGFGSGKECRVHVQKLNGVRGEMNELNESNLSTNENFEIESCNINKQNKVDSGYTKKESKWSEFIEKTEEITESVNQTMYLNNTEVVLDVPIKRKKRCGKQDFKIKSKIISPLQKNKIKTQVKNQITNTNAFGISALSDPDFPENITVDQKSDISIELKEDKSVIRNYGSQKTSKWSQFTDNSKAPSEDIGQSTTIENTLPKVPNTLFSLCDDSNLDSVLSI